jgi:NAD(P)-dependent dehydrogenase (short-subunit alcohol dehydrogenase family)
VRRCAERLGGLDGLVLNVGISRALPLSRLTAQSWDDEYAVNVRSHMLFSQTALEIMGPGAAIVLMSSLAAHRNAGRNPAYESSKAARIALARAIAVAGEPKGIRCNALCPGPIDTPMAATRPGTGRTARRPCLSAAKAPAGRWPTLVSS